MKHWLLPLMLGFGLTLAFVIGQRMSTDAMAVVIGVAVGVTASIPTTLLLRAVQRRERRNGHADPQPSPPAVTQPSQPNLIVLNLAELLTSARRGQAYLPLPPPEIRNEGGLR